MSRNIQLVIPMSGMGQRFVDAGYKDPKPLIQVDNKPIIVTGKQIGRAHV